VKLDCYSATIILYHLTPNSTKEPTDLDGEDVNTSDDGLEDLSGDLSEEASTSVTYLKLNQTSRYNYCPNFEIRVFFCKLTFNNNNNIIIIFIIIIIHLMGIIRNKLLKVKTLNCVHSFFISILLVNICP